MTLMDLAALVLACRAVLDVWFEEDSILAELRARTQLWDSWFWRTLFNCRFCMSYWVPAGLLLGLYVPSVFLEPVWAVIAKLPLYGLAVTGLVGLIDRAVPKSGDASTESDPAPAPAPTQWLPISATDPPHDLGPSKWARSKRVLLSWPSGQVSIGHRTDDGEWVFEGAEGGLYTKNPPTHYQPLPPHHPREE